MLNKQLAQLALPPYAKKTNPEGYLFPATYPVEPHETALAILEAMVEPIRRRRHSRWNIPGVGQRAREQRNRAHDSGGPVHHRRGSLVQAEAGRDKDMPQIAEVIYNRLKIGMPLKLDSTVFYGLGGVRDQRL